MVPLIVGIDTVSELLSKMPAILAVIEEFIEKMGVHDVQASGQMSTGSCCWTTWGQEKETNLQYNSHFSSILMICTRCCMLHILPVVLLTFFIFSGCPASRFQSWMSSHAVLSSRFLKYHFQTTGSRTSLSQRYLRYRQSPLICALKLLGA